MNIPVFVPHVGCPNDCAFCNQRSITGVTEAPDPGEVERIATEYLSCGQAGSQARNPRTPPGRPAAPPPRLAARPARPQQTLNAKEVQA